MSRATRSGHDAWTLLGVGVVALAAAVLSFSSLQQLAVRAGYSPTLAALLPLAIDAQAVVATRSWLAAHTPPRARRYARALALAAVAGSVAGNAGQHAMAAAGVETPWWVVVAIASVPPVALAMVAHLAALLATHRPAPRQAEHEAAEMEPSTEQPPATRADAHAADPLTERASARADGAQPSAQQGAQAPRATRSRARSAGRAPKGSQERARALFGEHADAGTLDQLTGREVADAGGVSPATGRRWLAQWRAEHARQTPHLAVVGQTQSSEGDA